jgi:hypothetical protein
MKRLKKGPELKMPELKVPAFASDLFYDLHDRRLLAPIVLVVVAIAAVPFLLGGGSETPPTKSSGVATPSAERKAAEAASLTVVQAKPGLRDYRKRLAGRTPTDPFEQRYTAPSTEGAELGSPSENSPASVSSTVTTSTSGSSSLNTETTTAGGSPSSSPSTSPSQPSGAQTKHHVLFYNWGIDAWIVKAGGADAGPEESPEASIKHKVLPQSALPGEKAPVVTYMGLSRKAAENHHAAKVLLLVSDEVTSVKGEAACASVAKHCKLLEVAPESPLTFIYGANETRYTIKVLKIELVVVGHG